MNVVDKVLGEYKEIHDAKSVRGEFVENDHIFATMALMYSIGTYCEKYRYLSNRYYSMVELFYSNKPREDIRDIDVVEDVENIRTQQDYVISYSENYEEIRKRMIRHIMNFDSEIDKETANKIFNMYFTIFIGGLLDVGDEKLSDRAISNLRLFDVTNGVFDYGITNSDYSFYAMPNYFKMANERFLKVRPSNTGVLRESDKLFYLIKKHKQRTNGANYFKDLDSISYSKEEGLYRIHNLEELNLHKKFNGRKIRQTDLFANPDYRTYKNIYPEVRSIVYGEQTRREMINEYLMDFVDRMLPYHSIDGAYTVRYSDTDYKLVMVTKDIEEYNRLLENIGSLLSSLNNFNNKVGGVSFTIMPLFAPYLRGEDYVFDSFKESLLDSDTILLDKKRFLRKAKGRIREEFREREAQRQYVKRD